MDQKFRRYSRNSHILIIYALTEDLSLTLRLMIIHHHNKFGYKKLSSSGDTVQTKSGHTDIWAQNIITMQTLKESVNSTVPGDIEVFTTIHRLTFSMSQTLETCNM